MGPRRCACAPCLSQRRFIRHCRGIEDGSRAHFTCWRLRQAQKRCLNVELHRRKVWQLFDIALMCLHGMQVNRMILQLIDGVTDLQVIDICTPKSPHGLVSRLCNAFRSSYPQPGNACHVLWA